jgi:phosphate-selective porin OprO/OprP
MKHVVVVITSLVLSVLAFDVLFAADDYLGFDKAWSYMTLYSNKDSNGVQKFAFVGRIQLDSVWVAPNDHESWNDVAWRRFRAGLKMDFLHNWVAHIEADFDLNKDINDWYTNLTDAYISWSPTNDLKVKILKQSVGFTLDGDTSSKNLLTLERNNVTNNLWFTEEYFNGALVSGKFAENWSYKASIFSSDGNPEWGWVDASWFTFLSIGVKWGNTKLNADYVYQDEDENANTRDFEQVLSLNGQWQEAPWGLRGDLAFGKGFENQGQSDAWGLYLMPYYDINKYTQIVLAYTYVDGDGGNSVRLNRYENKVLESNAIGGRGDRYNEVYGGLNVYFYGHKFKWQTGLSYATMDDAANDGGEFKGWTINTGLRIYW